MANNTVTLRPSQVVSALADMASQGRYDNVTKQGSRNMNALFEMVAQLINALEAQEAEEDNNNALEQATQDAAAIALAEDEGLALVPTEESFDE